MVNAYNQQSNPLMRRPIIQTEVLNFLREEQRPLTGQLAAIQAFAKEQNIPVIPQETIVYFQFLLELLRPEKILEIGTAIAFSSLLFAEICPTAKITTVERYEEMLVYARENLEKYDQRKQIQLIEADAAEFLPQLQGKFDFIFMDSAKTQYIKFLPYLLLHMNEGAVLAIDDVFQAGDVFKSMQDLPRRQRNIHKALNKLFAAVLDNPELQSSFLPLGDGLLLIKCKKNGAML